MKVWQCAWAAVLTLLAGCKDAPPVDPAKPDAYALRLAVTAAEGGTIQRLDLPAQALAAIRRDDLGDVRLFDSRGRRMTLALAEDMARAGRRWRDVPIYPVAGSWAASGRQDVTVRIENGTGKQVVTVAGDLAAASPSAAASSAVLVDTRAVVEPVQALRLDTVMAAARPVTLTVQTSLNLRDWQPLAETTLFRPQGSDVVLGDGRLALDGVDLANRYVMVRWPAGEQVEVRGARVETAVAEHTAVIEVEADGPVLAGPHLLRFDLPASAPVDAIRLRQAASDGTIPVRLLGRANAEQGWTLLSAATLRSGSAGQLLNGISPEMRQFRVEADRRTAGWSSSPRLSLRYRPVTVIADLSGTPPYQLAVGLAGAEPAYLERDVLLPDASTALTALPVARAEAGGQEPPRLTLAPPDGDGPLAPRKLALWGALLLGTAMLGFVAWRLARGLPAAPTGGD